MNASMTEAAEIIHDRSEDYLRLARRIAMGERVTPIEIAEKLRDVGKEAGDLESIVGNLKHREELRAKLVGVRELDARRIATQAQLDKARGELTDAQQKYEASLVVLTNEMNAINRATAEASSVPSQLAQTCPSAVLNRTAESLRRNMTASRQRAKGAKQQLDEYTVTFNSMVSPVERADFSQRIVRAKQAYADLTAETAALVAESDIAHQARIDF